MFFDTFPGMINCFYFHLCNELTCIYIQYILASFPPNCKYFILTLHIERVKRHLCCNTGTLSFNITKEKAAVKFCILKAIDLQLCYMIVNITARKIE